ncbi:SIR2 family NAD-dependent protein deacylase [Polaromonas naphthalenivorans]|uniref:protein acetyllysine N-acetyltransferase n=1 Tax=Polaromonas naphthalenivorans (strain CJ2) TaxID=365044 RepID=A1VQY9_POLNA|nr:Sir2 family NAD-dependent protein deacetylase [Polaromonas naphthalenivorans]ABM38067.1 Silent information regulator protein Sir2 [Polaromonas naphthalenivorans CJ2]
MSPSIDAQSLAHAADLISGADALIVAAGAGMGVDSGLPDFRGTEGFWKAYPVLGRDKVDFYSIACPDAFRTDPQRAWGFYGHRLQLYRATRPHPGFEILKCWGKAMPHGLSVFTSNVDGQFQKAGFEADSVYECHGSIAHLQCMEPCSSAIWPADGFVPEVDAAQCLLLNAPPVCPHCGGLARPNILMFNDSEWLEDRAWQQAARLERWLGSVCRPVVVELGAGTAIPSVRHFSQRIVQRFGGRLVRINPREFAVPTRLDVGIAAGAAHALAEIDRLMQAAPLQA